MKDVVPSVQMDLTRQLSQTSITQSNKSSSRSSILRANHVPQARIVGQLCAHSKVSDRTRMVHLSSNRRRTRPATTSSTRSSSSNHRTCSMPQSHSSATRAEPALKQPKFRQATLRVTIAASSTPLRTMELVRMGPASSSYHPSMLVTRCLSSVTTRKPKEWLARTWSPSNSRYKCSRARLTHESRMQQQRCNLSVKRKHLVKQLVRVVTKSHFCS